MPAVKIWSYPDFQKFPTERISDVFRLDNNDARTDRQKRCLLAN